MQQTENIFSTPVIILTLGIYCLVCFAQETSLSSADAVSDSDFTLGRPQDLGLAKPIYGYLSEYKRYPVYSFGLGKRSSHLYNFGLGKRSRIDEGNVDLDEYDEYPYNQDEDLIPELELYNDDMMQSMDKRQPRPPYSFGLGKRMTDDDLMENAEKRQRPPQYSFGLGKRFGRGDSNKRVSPHRYNFGLGKRSPGALNGDRMYSFGLGKRNRLYSFGLGKRLENQGLAPGRFNFGLGKRFENFDASRNKIAKREIHKEIPQEAAPQGNNQPTDSSQVSTSKMETLSNPEVESHEVMGHPGKSQVSKRSPYKYAFESGKPVFRSNSGFSRQFRKPLYSFGLGKRNPSSNTEAAKNYKASEN